jgi:hypothetical protein
MYAKGLLAGVAAVFGVLFVPALVHFFWGMSIEKATGLAVVTSGFVEAFLSPLFWVEAFCVFALFLATSRLGSKALRVLLFWAPAFMITTLGCAVIGLLTFVSLRFKR